MDPATEDRTSAKMLTYATSAPRLSMKTHVPMTRCPGLPKQSLASSSYVLLPDSWLDMSKSRMDSCAAMRQINMRSVVRTRPQAL